MTDDLLATIRAEREAALLATPVPGLGLAVPLADERGAFGPPLLAFCPRHHLLLSFYENPCLVGGPRALPAVLQYLWLCSAAYRAGSRLRFGLFAWRWQFAVSTLERTPSGRRVRVPTMRALRAIEHHTAALLRDRPALPVPKGRAGPSAGAAHELTVLLHLAQTHLRISEERFWSMPYQTLNQRLALHFSVAPDAPRFDPAREKAKGAYLRRRIAEDRAAAARAASRN